MSQESVEKKSKKETRAPEAQPTQNNATKPSMEEALGAVSWLLTRSAGHRHLFLTDIDWLVMPPLQLMQFRIFRDDKRPLGFVTWARVSEEVEARMLQGANKLAPKDWVSGDRLWIVDVVAPFGGAGKMLEEVQTRLFKDKEVKVIRPREDGKGVEGTMLKDFLESIKNPPKVEPIQH